MKILNYFLALLVTLFSYQSRDPIYKSIRSRVAVILIFELLKMYFCFLQPNSQNYPLRDKLSFQNEKNLLFWFAN